MYLCAKINKMNMKRFIPIIISLSLFFAIPVFAGTPPPVGGDPTTGGGTPIGGGAPVGSGLAIFIAIGAAYGARKTYLLQKEEA